MRRLLIAASVLTFSAPAMAGQCPALWQQIDQKVQSAQLTEAQKAEVAEHRKRGEELHGTGHHAESEAALNAALAILN